MNAPSSTGPAGLQFTHPYLAVVLGGGFSGMLAAAALSGYADVVVVERDRLPRTPALPTDLPQARHAHLLSADGARTVEALLPGVIEGWLAGGARPMPLPSAPAGPAPQGRLSQRSAQCVIACSRDLLDRVVREQVPALEGVGVLDGTEAEELTGTAEHITGVRVRDTVTGRARRLDADLVIDATGRHSTTPARLAALGLPEVREEIADCGIVAATRIFRAPPGTENCPVITARSHPGGHRDPGRTATLIPIEGGRWLVTLTGAGAGRPSEHADRFVPFARGIPHSVIGDLIADAEPLSEVRLTRDTAGRLRRYDQLRSWPTGFAVLGGAVAGFTPDYGQSMAVAAHGALALREALHRRGLDDPGLARAVQQSLARITQAPWEQTADQAQPAAGRRPSAAGRFVRDAVNGVFGTALGRPPVCRAYVDAVRPATSTARFTRRSASVPLPAAPPAGPRKPADR
ncbi:NAD(P)/FAD-dependent oxidoreductase [Streptomyces chattanoogensis]|uniref:Pyridine nucleotide-disulfide oxidoreductase n=1 Tax=Streptomyces chattanoogensis TaxID=66876 RepID=A0A0N0GWB2_9ACTN|nr:FAD-dependent monooxygenase [Streptomyces chattanoogensis]KPC60009.1 pyridine nucleotide-disulfide oxidoreductase [Streptomyces chattanoogensis]